MSNYAWLKGKWRPVKSHRLIKRGRKKGWVEVELFFPEGRLRIIHPEHLKMIADTTDAGSITSTITKRNRRNLRKSRKSKR